jgi:hypothetical protein
MCKLSFGLFICLTTVLMGCATSPSLPSLPKVSLPKPDLSALPNPLSRFKAAPEETQYATPEFDFSKYPRDPRRLDAAAQVASNTANSARDMGSSQEPLQERSRLNESTDARIAAMESLVRQHEAKASRLLSGNDEFDPRVSARSATGYEQDPSQGERSADPSLKPAKSRGFWSRLWNRGSDSPEQLAAQSPLRR